jgi:hypothetical protein
MTSPASAPNPVAVPIVIYGLMPQLHRLRGRLLTRTVSA